MQQHGHAHAGVRDLTNWTSIAHPLGASLRYDPSHPAALCALGRDTPVAVTDALLKAGLLDRSSRVRWKAVDRANTLERRNLVPEITAALVAESDDKARGSMELDLRMLRDGHWIQPESPGRSLVTARLHNGGITSRTVSDDEFRAKGLESILAELRR